MGEKDVATKVQTSEEFARVLLAKELDTRFTYHAPKEGQPAKYERMRAAAKVLAETVCELCPDSRERSLALTKLDEVVFWSNASIARRG